MTVKEAQQELKTLMTQLYDASEARGICRYVFEDYLLNGLSLSLNDSTMDVLLESQYNTVKEKLLEGIPVQYVVGFAWFYGIKLKVNNTVLIPRPETEELVEWILEDTKNSSKEISCLDIGTGSGCIPIVLGLKNPKLKLSAVDVSESALITAGRNAFRHNIDIDFSCIDILDPVHQKKLLKFDIIVSNPPYISEAEKKIMHANVLDHEPHLALFVHNTKPLLFYETIADFAQTHLNVGGDLYFECNTFNASDVKKMLESKNFSDIIIKKDMSENDRMIRAQFFSFEL